MTLLCIWQYLKPVKPGAIEGLSVPFAEVVERAVATVKVKAKRSKSPGVIHWSSKQRGEWFADLLKEKIVLENPKSKKTEELISGTPRSLFGKELKAAVEKCRVLTPADLDHFTEGRVLEIGGANLMGPLWIIPSPDPILQSLGALPGATVAFLPVETSESVGALLSVLGSRSQAKSERMKAEVETVNRETNRRRMVSLRQQAEGISRLASWIEVDMTAIGESLLEAEKAIRDHLRVREYPKPLSFVPKSKAVRVPELPDRPSPKVVSRASRDLPQLTAPPPPPLVGDAVVEISEDKPRETAPPKKRSMRRKR